MPNWKKVIVSGSDATLNSLFVATSVTASVFSGSYTGSLFGTSSWASNATSASYAKTASYVNTLNQPVIISGSLNLNSPDVTVGQFVGNQNGYIEFSIRNTSTGQSASGDLAIYADNGTATSNYVDLGINNSGLNSSYFYGGTYFGNALDAYLYNVGGNFRIGNATSTSPFSQSLFLFANPAGTIDLTITGSRVGIQKSSSLNATLDVNGNTIISGSLTLFGPNNATPNIITQNSSLILQGNAGGNSNTAAQLRITANTNAWTDNLTASYFQIKTTGSFGSNNYVVFQGGTYGADAPFDRLQFASYYTSFINAAYGNTPAPLHLVEMVNTTASVPVLGIRGATGQTANYININASGSATGSTFSITKDGVVMINTTASSTESNLFLGGLTTTEGGQLTLQPGLSYNSGAMLDNWQDTFRILRGTATTSNASVASFNLTSRQFNLAAYTGSGTFPGTAVATLAVDSAGNVITTTGGSTTPGGSTTQIQYNNGGAFGGVPTLVYSGGVLSATGSFTGSLTGSVFGTASWAQSASQAVTSAYATNADWFDGLNSSVFAFTGSNTFKGNQTISSSLIVTGSTSLTGSLGILGTVSASSYTGSFFGTASWALSASNAISAAWAPGGSSTFPYTGNAVISGSLTVTGSTTLTGSLNVLGTVSASAFSGSFFGTASWALSASNAITSAFIATASYANNANLLDGLDSTIFATTGSNTFRGTQTISGSLIVTGSTTLTGSLSILGAVSASSYTGSLLGTASYALAYSGTIANAQTASYVLQAVSASYAATASTISTGYYVTQSKGGTWFNSAGFSAGDTGSITIWRAPYPCTASTIYAWREGGTTAAVSASKNGLALTSSNMVLGTAATYFSSSATTNQNFSTGDRLEITLVSFTGTVTEVNVQVDFKP